MAHNILDSSEESSVGKGFKKTASGSEIFVFLMPATQCVPLDHPWWVGLAFTHIPKTGGESSERMDNAGPDGKQLPPLTLVLP